MSLRFQRLRLLFGDALHQAGITGFFGKGLRPVEVFAGLFLVLLHLREAAIELGSAGSGGIVATLVEHALRLLP